MSGPARTPPRFVPTLTSVVALPEGAARGTVVRTEGGAGHGELPPPTGLALRAESADLSSTAVASPAPASSAEAIDSDALRIQQDLLERLSHQIETAVRAQLTDAVMAVVEQQIEALLPRLRLQVEQALRPALTDAVAQALAEAKARAGAGSGGV